MGELMPSPSESPGGPSSCSPRDPREADSAGDSELMRQQPRMDEELKQMFIAKGLTEENLQVIQASDDTICSVADLASGAVSETDARSWADELGLTSRVLKSRFIQSWLEARNVLHRMLEAYSPLPTGQSSPQPWSPRQAWTPEAGMSSPGGRSLGSSFRHATPPVAESPKDIDDFDVLSSRCTIPDEKATLGSSRESLTPTGSDIWRQPERRPIYGMSRPSTPVKSKLDSPPRLGPLKEADGEMQLMELEESPAETAAMSTPDVSNLDPYARLQVQDEIVGAAGQADSRDSGESRIKDADPTYGGRSGLSSDTARSSSELLAFGLSGPTGRGDSTSEVQRNDEIGSASDVLESAATILGLGKAEAPEEPCSPCFGSVVRSTLSSQLLSMNVSGSVGGGQVWADGSSMPVLGFADGGRDGHDSGAEQEGSDGDLELRNAEDSEPEFTLLTDPHEEQMTPGAISCALHRILRHSGRLTFTEIRLLEQKMPYRTVRTLAECVPSETDAIRLADDCGITSKVSRLRFADAWQQCVSSITAMNLTGGASSPDARLALQLPEGPPSYQLFAMTVRGDWEGATLRLMERAGLRQRQEVAPFIRGLLSHISHSQLRQSDTAAARKSMTQRKVLPIVEKAYGCEVAKRVARRAEVFEADARWRIILKSLFHPRTAIAFQKQILEMHRSSYFEAACVDLTTTWAKREKQSQRMLSVEVKMSEVEALCYERVIKRILPHFGFTPDARGVQDIKELMVKAANEEPEVAKLRNEISRMVVMRFFSDLKQSQDGQDPPSRSPQGSSS